MAVPKTQSTTAHYKQRIVRRKQARLRSLALVISGVLILIAATILLSRQPVENAASLHPPRAGQPMPDFMLNDLSGETVRLSDFAGRPVLINAWATWCPPCRAEMPQLHEFYLQTKDQGFVLLAVNAGESSNLISQFIQQTGFSFPVLLDPETEALSRLGVMSFPTSILVGRDGMVKKIHIGLITSDVLENQIAPLLGLE